MSEFSNPKQEEKFQEILSKLIKLHPYIRNIDDFDRRAIFLSGVEFGTAMERERKTHV